ncbi:nucleotide disphospho-sugar-binding domain-containing protein [Paenibacillus sp. IHBB 10380]|uniref:nucleotide disphospho-sugar-binding domain-containing protein n=1 Tax=Paenibacillus sp. IHBB 10380 TaxID=1566358 RepID=UPI001364D9A1|nr:nucleotide disphospho-sugar-binding domain-containing protein [Paenibacillus sp. IHBB 10380]
MSNIIFFSIPLFGHVNYGLKIAKQLAVEGHQVYYFSGVSFKDFIRKKGVQFCHYSDGIEALFNLQDSTYNKKKMSEGLDPDIDYLEELWKLSNHLFDITRIISKIDLEYIKTLNPDLILYDNIAIWGKLIAESLGIRCISSGTPYCYSQEMITNYPEEFARCILKKPNINGNSIKSLLRIYDKMLHQHYPEFKDFHFTMNYSGSGDLNFIYTSRSFQLHPELIDESINAFVGVIIDDDDQKADITSYLSQCKKTIYVALGTIYNNKNLYKACINALRGYEANIIMSIGDSNVLEDFIDVPSEWHIGNHLPQIKLLEHVDVFVTHGGVNSVREAAHFGVPVVVIPQTGDHFLVAEDVKRTQIGRVIDGEFDPTQLLSAIEDCLYNPSIQRACASISKEMQQCGGLDDVVSKIQALIHNN